MDVRFPVLDSMRAAAPAWTRGAYDAVLRKNNFDETKHPRVPTGGENGGQFAPKNNSSEKFIDTNLGKIYTALGKKPLSSQVFEDGLRFGTVRSAFSVDSGEILFFEAEDHEAAIRAYLKATGKKASANEIDKWVRSEFFSKGNGTPFVGFEFRYAAAPSSYGQVEQDKATENITMALEKLRAMHFPPTMRVVVDISNDSRYLNGFKPDKEPVRFNLGKSVAVEVSMFPLLDSMRATAPVWTRGAFDVVLRKAGQYDESKHPRVPAGDENGGQFAPKGIGAATIGVGAPTSIVSKFPPPTVSELSGGTLLRVHQFVSKLSETNARELFALIPEYMRRGLKTLTLRPDAPQMKVGLATLTTLGDYKPDNQGLRLFNMAKPMSKSEIASTLNHEAGHHLYHRFGALTLAERTAAQITSTAVGGMFVSDEQLIYDAPKSDASPEYQAAVQIARTKYPLLAARRDFMRAHDTTGGVSNYSESYTKVGKGIAADETFAELTRFYMDDVHHKQQPLYRFYIPTHPQYPKRAVADAYLNILKLMQEHDAATAVKSIALMPADEDAILKCFDADGNECAPEDAVMAELRGSDGSSVIYAVSNTDEE